MEHGAGLLSTYIGIHLGSDMSLVSPKALMSRNDQFIFVLGFTQMVFILILYRQQSVSVFSGFVFLSSEKHLDYSKPVDVYTNLSLFTPAMDLQNMPSCLPKSPILAGPIKVVFAAVPSFETTVKKNPYVFRGGRYMPPHCKTHYKAAIIIPHRNREKHLHYLLYYLHPFLQRQQLQYTVYVIHQAGNSTFNKAKLLNIGVKEALKVVNWNCLIIQDVDLIPENDHNLYVCDENTPKHLSSGLDKYGYRVPYWYNFGGVAAFTPDQYMKMNGFPNRYWGWGGEDDEIAKRIQLAGMSLTRTPPDVGHYKTAFHGNDKGNEISSVSYDLLKKASSFWKEDGINSLEYRLISRKKDLLYTNITVDVGFPPKSEPTLAPATALWFLASVFQVLTYACAFDAH